MSELHGSMMNSLPFAETRHGVIPPHLHAMLSVKAMLCVAEKGATAVSEADLIGCFADLLGKPDSELLGLIQSNVTTAAAAAGLVFMHSAYENAIFDLIKRLVRYDPEPWLQFIDKKMIPFEQLKASTVPKIREGLLEDWLKKVERNSFPWKVETLFAVLRPETPKDVIPGFEFNLAEFKAIDQLRHDLTHRANFGEPIPDIYAKLSYLHKTVLLLEKLAEQKYPGLLVE